MLFELIKTWFMWCQVYPKACAGAGMHIKGEKKESISKGSARQLNSVGLVNSSSQSWIQRDASDYVFIVLFYFLFWNGQGGMCLNMWASKASVILIPN